MRKDIFRAVLLILVLGCASGGKAAAQQCGFNAVGDFICPRDGLEEFRPPANPFERPPPSRPPVYAPPVTLPEPWRKKQIALAECFRDAIADSGGEFGVDECNDVRQCMIDKGYEDPGFTCSPPGAGGPPVALCIPPGNTEVAATCRSIQSVLASAACGTTINLSPGDCGGFTYDKNCAQGSPVVITAGTQTGVRFTGAINVLGSGLIIHGAEISNMITVDGDYNRVTQALFTAGGRINYLEGSSYNRFDHNDVTPGAITRPFMGFFRPRNTEQMYLSNGIDSNYFSSPGAAGGLGMAIFLGMYGADEGYPYLRQFGMAGTVIANNLFEDWGGTAVEIKFSENFVTVNTFRNSGRLLLRHGYHNTVDANCFERSQGVDVREADHIISNNYLDGGKIDLLMGVRKYQDGTCFQYRHWIPAAFDPQQGAPQGPPAVNVTVLNNRGSLRLGADEGGRDCEMPVLNTNIQCHEGPVEITNDWGTRGQTSSGAIGSCGFTMPHCLTREEVGRGSPDEQCE